jgi:ABC-type dipeptide/oligopeptide/nickel transport system permease component
MIRYAALRLVLAIPTLLGMLTVIFVLVRLVPGDAAMVILGEQANEAALQALRSKLGLDQPLYVQYLDFLGGVLTGDFGRSLASGRPVLDEVRFVLPYTIELTAAALGLGVIFGLLLGVLAAVRRNQAADYFGRIFSLVGLSFPAFVSGILLLLVFAVELGWFPVLGEDYIRTARAKGVRARQVIMRHGLRNALIPIITVVGLYFGTLIGNSVLTEIVFNRPGLGKLILGALNTRDYALLQGLMIVFAICIIVVNTLTDLAYGFVDPRVKYK